MDLDPNILDEMIKDLDNMTDEEFVEDMLRLNPDMERYILPNLINKETGKPVQFAVTKERKKELDIIAKEGKESAERLKDLFSKD